MYEIYDMKLINLLPIFLFLMACTSTNKTTIERPLLNSISIGNMKNLNFEGHVARPKYETDNLVTYHCSSTPRDIQLSPSSKDLDYVEFFCFNYQKYAPYVENIFNNSISLSSQKKYFDIKILWGDAIYQTSPDTYIVRKSHPINDTVIFHELGHRLSFLLEENLKIPLDLFGFVTMGIIDYFAASIANDPVLAKDFAPSVFIRNVSLEKKYPKDLSFFKDFTEKFYSTYSKDFKTKEYHKRFYQIFQQMVKQNKELVDGHGSGMIISSLLWNLREKFGQEKMDVIVAQSMLRLQDLSQFRSTFLPRLSKPDSDEKTIQWYDFLTSVLITVREKDSSLDSCQFVMSKFKNAGFDITSKTHVSCN